MRLMLLLLVAAATVSCGDGSAAPPTDALVGELPGVWEVVLVDGGAPSAFNIRSHTITLDAGGTWRSESTMLGPWEGTTLKASGTWERQSNGFNFTAGANARIVVVSSAGSTLRFHPDPMLTRPGGSPPVDTEYRRVPGSGRANPALQPPPQSRRG